MLDKMPNEAETDRGQGPWALVSQRVVTPSGIRAAAVLIAGETIVDVIEPAEVPASCRVEDVGDRVVLPGIVDTHVHINEPGRTEWEGFVTATRAAAAGGITTLVDMPLNSSPVTTTAEALAQKLEAARGKLCGRLRLLRRRGSRRERRRSGRSSPPEYSASRRSSATRGSTSFPMPPRPTSAR